jgi:hypothetical protein
MADTVPDRPSLPVTVRTPATDCHRAPVQKSLTPTFGTSFVPSPNCHAGKPYSTGAGIDTKELNVEQEQLIAAAKPELCVKHVTGYRARRSLICNHSGALVDHANEGQLIGGARL